MGRSNVGKHKNEFDAVYSKHVLYEAIRGERFDAQGVAYKSTAHRFFWWEAFENIVSLLNLQGRESMLNIGVGFGFDEKVIHRRFPNMTLCGIDVSEAMIRAALSNRSPAMLAVSLGEQLPFRDRSFDRVVSREVIEHVMDPQMFLSEIRRVTAPGGRIVITTPNPDSLAREQMMSGVRRIFGLPQPPRHYHETLLKPNELETLFIDGGFRIVRNIQDGACKFWLYEMPKPFRFAAFFLARMAQVYAKSPFGRLFCNQTKYVLEVCEAQSVSGSPQAAIAETGTSRISLLNAPAPDGPHVEAEREETPVSSATAMAKKLRPVLGWCVFTLFYLPLIVVTLPLAWMFSLVNSDKAKAGCAE